MKRFYLVRRRVLNETPSRGRAVFHVRRAGFRRDPGQRARSARRLIALFLALVFTGSVILAAWPRLYLPSLDFVFDSLRISLDSRVRRLQPAVVHLTVLAGPGNHDSSRFVVQQQGTGFNIHPSGVVITNNHVLMDARRAAVTFPDGSVFNIGKIYAEPTCDLAVAMLENASGLPVASLGDSGRANPGDRIFVIGNPLGMKRIVVAGSLGRTLRLKNSSLAALELIAPVHPGNSGSPVMNTEGQVIGVVFGVLKTEDGVHGLALPANSVQHFLNTIMPVFQENTE